jgi:hypothetical protein
MIIGPAILAQQRVVRPSNGLAIEAETLAAAAQASQGHVGVQNMRGFGAAWSGGAQLFWGGAQAGAQLRLVFTTTATGRYEVFLQFTRAPDFAVVQARLDGAPPVTFDGYAPTVSRDGVSLGIRELTPGAHELRFAVMEKNSQSSGFNVGLDVIEVRPPNRGAVPASIPVLQVPAVSASPEESSEHRGVEPLPMNTRVELTQKALSSPSTPLGTPGDPLRLSARITKRLPSALRVRRGTLDARKERSLIVLPVGAILDLYFEPVVPARPHLLECGSFSQGGAQIRLTVRTDNKWAELATFSVTNSDDRLLAVVVPSQPRIELTLSTIKGTDFRVFYCELTPFN